MRQYLTILSSVIIQQKRMRQSVEISGQGDAKEQYLEALDLFMTGRQQELLAKLNQLASVTRIRQSHQLVHNKQNIRQHSQHLQFEEKEEGANTKRVKPKLRYPSQRISQYCSTCPENEEVVLLSASNYAYVALPKLKTFKRYQHFVIAPIDHIQTRIGADEGVTEELRNFQKCLTQMLDSMNLHAVYIEQFSSNNSHFYIECLGIPLKKAYDLPFFFKQALENVEGFWTTHKRIIEIRKEKGGLEKQIPKQMKYFYVDFGLGYGYAHVIQDEKYWDRNFCYEIIAAGLGLESFEVKTTEQYSQIEQDAKSKEFDKRWKKYDWTALI